MKRFSILLAALTICALASAQNFEVNPEKLKKAPDRPIPDAPFVVMPDSIRNQPDKSMIFASFGDTLTLSMDIFSPKNKSLNNKCIVYVYGGGFKDNNQKAGDTRKFCRRLADDGFVVAAIDYRLGLKDVHGKGKSGMIKPLQNALRMACEDLMSAVKCILDNSTSLCVDPENIILCGSSAGAMTVLQSDYELCNRTEVASVLPDDFHFAGVISFAGAIFSTNGKVSWKEPPAPTFLLHGTADKLVNYDKMALFNLRLAGTNDLAKRFKKFGYNCLITRFEGEGHGVAARQLSNYDDVIWFIETFVTEKRNLIIDETTLDRDHKRPDWDLSTPGTYY